MKCAGDVAKGYALAWVRLRVLGIAGAVPPTNSPAHYEQPMPPKSGTQIRTQASAEIGCARVASRVYWRDRRRCAVRYGDYFMQLHICPVLSLRCR